MTKKISVILKPFPKDVEEVDPKIIATMKRRLAEESKGK